MSDPERDRGTVVKHLDHLRLLLSRGLLEKASIVARRVIDVRARQRKVLDDEHARRVGATVEVVGQDVGDHTKGVEIGLLRRCEVGIESRGSQLIEPVRRRVAGASKKYRPPVYREGPPARADIPRQLAKRERVVHASRFGRPPSTRDELRAVDRLLTEPPRIPPARAGKGEPHGHRVVSSACEAHLALEAQRLAARHRHAELDLPLHLATVEVAQPRLDFEAPIAALEVRLDPHPVDRDRPDVLELDGAPQSDRHLPLVSLGKASIRRRGVRLQVAVVEQPHDVALLLRRDLDRRLAADHQQVLRLQVRRQVETEWREVSVMRSEQLSVQPDVRGEERSADAQHDATRMVRARHLDRLPTGAASDGQPFRLALAERHPDRLPCAELTGARRALRHRQEQTVTHSLAATYAPSAVAQMRVGRPIDVAKFLTWARSTRASTLPPKPAPMMRAPKQPAMLHAFSTSASTVGVETSKSSRRLSCDCFNSRPISLKSRRPNA